MNEETVRFIKEQKLQEELFFDAEGQPVSQLLDKMKSLGKIFAYNTTPCKTHAHTLRSRAGHCIQCDTSKIAYMLRSVSYGTVYIAGSIKGQFIKIGTTSDKRIRASSLNRTKYGNQDDWEILLSFSCWNSGEIEDRIQKSLSLYEATDIKYDRNTKTQLAYELFRCSYRKARESVFMVLKDLKLSSLGLSENKVKAEKYNFKSLIRL